MTGRPSLDGVLDTSGGRKSGAESAMEVATISPKIPKPPADPIQRYAGMRRNFERVRLLCELIKKREKMKRETVLIGEKILNKTFKPPAILLQETLDKLIEKDHQQVGKEIRIWGREVLFKLFLRKGLNFEIIDVRKNSNRDLFVPKSWGIS